MKTWDDAIKASDALVNGQEAEWRTIKGHHIAIGENGEIVAGGIPNTSIGAKQKLNNAIESANSQQNKNWVSMSKQDREDFSKKAFEKYGEMTLKDPELVEKVEEASKAFKKIKKEYDKNSEFSEELFSEFKKAFECVEYGDFGKKWQSMLNKYFGSDRDSIEFLEALRRTNSAEDIEDHFSR